ncbi:putative ripening-related protein 1 [Cryptomeria japonica]|uniref:putative ripening-related protein 1 n=1 Tax=Cryptomeria japonica TaxID=3369 RepID=UPI0027DA3547|nr:putative ripening-related protein 1 [Cryptomeria japonica]
MTSTTPTTLTLNGFQKGKDRGGPSECDEDYHNDNDLVVALSTGWYTGGSRCHEFIVINPNNGRSMRAMVVDECNSISGCDEDHDFQRVWKALGVDNYDDVGEMSITWSEA